MTKSDVKISVIMPVFNAAAYLKEAVDSILEQTFTDFEFLIFDDGSTDDSRSILQSYTDPRIRLFLQDENTGYVRHLNRGLEMARGEYVFRMDADDISLPSRFAKQVAFLDQHPEVGLCGAWIRTIDTPPKTVQRPSRHEDIVLSLLNSPTFCHPAVAFRTSLIRKHRLSYKEAYLYAEDYELWAQITNYTKVAILPEVLLLYRIHQTNVSIKFKVRQIVLINKVRIIQFEQLLGRDLNAIERKWVTFGLDFNGRLPLTQIAALKKEIIAANELKRKYDPILLKSFLLQRTAKMIKHQPKNRLFW